MHIPLFNKGGAAQHIVFPPLEDVSRTAKYIVLQATSSANLPVRFYVKSGPAYLTGDQLVLTAIPPKAKFPLKVTVVAWQYGIAGRQQSATPMERSFWIN